MKILDLTNFSLEMNGIPCVNKVLLFFFSHNKLGAACLGYYISPRVE